MDDLEFDDPTSPVFHHPVLVEARRSFRAFYSTATPHDQTWFDMLVMAHVALTPLQNHMIDEEPRLFFMHWWGVGKPDVLARGVKAAIGQMKLKAEK